MRHIVRWLLACRENEAELSKKRMARGLFTRVGSDRIEMHTDAVAYRVSYHNRDRKHKVVISFCPQFENHYGNERANETVALAPFRSLCGQQTKRSIWEALSRRRKGALLLPLASIVCCLNISRR